ncbi:protein of unknown function (DUF2973) [Rubidibacter lacunae KORDI 51-2]|uniref:DUF2973 domain-containing protein n=1 Tax=Rubidibacter lacunae KORDI 51-2 TaxID=582515 RepID=U5DMG2_9CHRO|nr:DUF2973 domain-containing protein [Rubidibacter lacunae]ERN41789.1 protein of unknown function (DUF2973) [Rubidibacter lacunae KORDI 51-2]
MLHLLYILAFSIIAFLAVSNLIRSMVSVNSEPQISTARRRPPTPEPIHPELLDERGRPIDEPLLVMRSVSVEDAREKLDALYENSPGVSRDDDDTDRATAH